MEIKIKATNIELNPPLREFTEKKIKSLEKFLQPILRKQDEVKGEKEPRTQAYVEVGKPSMHHKKGKVFYAECQLPIPGKSLRATSKKETLKEAIVEVKNDLQRQIKKYKNKQRAQGKKGGRKVKEKDQNV